MTSHGLRQGGHCYSWHHHKPMGREKCGGWAAGLTNEAAQSGSGCEDVFRLGDLARKLARIRGSGVSCFAWNRACSWAKMAADAKPVATLFENKGAGLELHHSWSGGFPPLSCFCREQLCRDSQGDLSCFPTVPPSILDLTLFKNYTQIRLQPTGFEHQRSSNMPLLFRINCFYRKFSPEYPPSFCHPRRI